VISFPFTYTTTLAPQTDLPPMSQLILAIMLYLGIITAPNTYHLKQLKGYETQYAVAISDVQGDPSQMVTVQQDYMPMTEEIIIIDDTQW
jgi:hypothetical protein